MMGEIDHIRGEIFEIKPLYRVWRLYMEQWKADGVSGLLSLCSSGQNPETQTSSPLITLSYRAEDCCFMS